jgi:hypothetical protein
MVITQLLRRNEMFGPKKILVVVLVVLLLVTAGLAQNTKSKIKQLTPTIKGSTGLFNIPTSDTLRRGEFSFGAAMTKFNREPGDIDITQFPATFTIGLHDRVELGIGYEAYQRSHANYIYGEDYHFSTYGHYYNPTVPVNGSVISYYNDTPFFKDGFGSGPGGLWINFKFNILSERYGNAFGLAVRPLARLSLRNNQVSKLNQGLSPGANDYGFDVIATKNVGPGAITATGGLLFAEDKAWAPRQNRINYGVGIDMPLGTEKAHFIGEFIGTQFYGDRRFMENPAQPVDLYGGFRFFPAREVAISVAYNFLVNTIDEDRWSIPATDRHGWLVQAVLQRKINRAPTAVCSAEQSTVIESNSVRVSADVDDQDDDVLTVTWKASGGRISGQDSSAVFDSTGLAPGSYTVMAEATDGENIASCSADIRVEKNKMAPTITCESGTLNVTEGQSRTLRAQASDPNGDALTYAWTVDGSAVRNDSAGFEFGTQGRSLGAHTVGVTVTDVDGMTANCEFRVMIDRRPNTAPRVSLALNKAEVFACEKIVATATGSDPEGDPLTYSWKVDGQPYPGSGSSITIDTCALAGGAHTVTATVTDDRGATTSASKTFNVTEKITILVDSRVDNVAKAKLDEIAVKMQQNPGLKAVLTGHTDNTGSETANEKAGLRRAEKVKTYLVKQHSIDADRIATKSAGQSDPAADNSTAEGRKQNRRVVVELSM